MKPKNSSRRDVTHSAGIPSAITTAQARYGQALQPYATFPSWWRTFAFRILGAREIATYLYLTCWFGKSDDCYPSIKWIATESGLKDENQVASALTQLTKLGFIERERTSVRSFDKRQRYRYYRPSVAITLLRLLDAKVIDGELRPRHGGKVVLDETSMEGKGTESALALGLTTLLGSALYKHYIREHRTSEALKRALRQRLGMPTTLRKAAGGLKGAARKRLAQGPRPRTPEELTPEELASIPEIRTHR